MKRVALASIMFAAAVSLVSAQTTGSRPAVQQSEPAVRQPQAPPPSTSRPSTQTTSSERGANYETAGPAEEKISQTSHVLRLDGLDIHYTATAGTLPIPLDDGKIAARMFFVAYTKDGEDVHTRPISFLYNGGPGSASVFLHMEAFAPRRAKLADDGFQPAPPYQLIDNEYSLIDTTDLVFIDAIDTGYSRVVPGVDNTQFHGQEGDIRAFGEFIDAYLSAYNRWPSPKYLIGESYGTIRSAGLSQELQARHGIELNGIVLISSLLTYQTLSPAPDNDVAYASQVETYAATAWYHKKLPADLQQKTVKQVVDEARMYVWGEYLPVLTKGNTLTDSERRAAADRLARFTGLSPQFILNNNLRIDPARFRKELLRDHRLVVGRADSRDTGVDGDAGGEREEADPSEQVMQGAFTALFKDYMKNDLKWDTDLEFKFKGNVQPWKYVENRYMDESDALRQTMQKNPFLKVFIACGYYDMATVVGGTEFNVSHFAYEPSVTDRVSLGYYESGHMVYIRPSTHKALKQDIVNFMHDTSGIHATSPR